MGLEHMDVRLATIVEALERVLGKFQEAREKESLNSIVVNLDCNAESVYLQDFRIRSLLKFEKSLGHVQKCLLKPTKLNP